MAEHRHTEPRTPEQDTEVRRLELERDWALVRAAKAGGGRVAGWTGGQTLVNPEVFGLKRPDADDEHHDLGLPRIRRRDVFLPLEDRTLTPLAFTEPLRKTPAKERKFLAKCTRAPELKRFYLFEAGNDHERRALSVDPKEALDAVRPSPGELIRGVVLDCHDKPTATVLAEKQNLAQQHAKERVAKRARLDKVIRQMQREAV